MAIATKNVAYAMIGNDKASEIAMVDLILRQEANRENTLKKLFSFFAIAGMTNNITLISYAIQAR